MKHEFNTSNYKCSEWIRGENIDFVLYELSKLAEYCFDHFDRDAIVAGLLNTDGEKQNYFRYSFIGKNKIDIALANEIGTNNLMLMINAESSIVEKSKLIVSIAQSYKIICNLIK